jgi:hypothetical protein
MPDFPRSAQGSGRIPRAVKIAVLIAIVLAPLAVGGLMYLVGDTWKSSYRLSNALRNARSVSFVEYQGGESGSFVLVRREATADDISRFRRATSPWFLAYKPNTMLCFEPHHSVDIVRSDGTELRFLVCFLCENFAVCTPDDGSAGREVALPPSWDKSLRSFFTSIGMAPKTAEEYAKLYRQRYHRTNMQSP